MQELHTIQNLRPWHLATVALPIPQCVPACTQTIMMQLNYLPLVMHLDVIIIVIPRYSKTCRSYIAGLMVVIPYLCGISLQFNKTQQVRRLGRVPRALGWLLAELHLFGTSKLLGTVRNKDVLWAKDKGVWYTTGKWLSDLSMLEAQLLLRFRATLGPYDEPYAAGTRLSALVELETYWESRNRLQKGSMTGFKRVPGQETQWLTE